MRYEIYLHKNTINNKVYVGLTSNSMMHRWSEHLKKARYYTRFKKSSYFHQAIIKYGTDVWEHQLLEIIDGELEQAKSAETKWIRHYKSNDPNFGYNLNEGGRVAGSTMDERTKQKLSEATKKLMQDPARREAHSKFMKEWTANNPNPFAGKTHSEESLAIMGAKSKAYQEANGNPFAGKTHDEETRKRMSEAAKKRCEDPNWQAPLQKEVRDETREKMAAAKRGKHSGKISKDDILRVSKECKTRKQIAEKLGCTPANITFLIKSFNIGEEINKTLTHEKF